MSMNAGMAITLYRRPYYTEQLFTALSNCYNIGQFDVHISCDYNPEYDAACNKVYDMAQDWAAEQSFPVTVYQNNPRLGIDINKLFVVPKALEKNDFVVFLEDDTIPSKDALNYFSTNIWKHRDDEDVIAVCGYNRTIPFQQFYEQATNKPYDIWYSNGFNPWGWAMHKKQWIRLFGDGGNTYVKDTGTEANGRFDWWIHGHNYRIVQPVVARVQSIGGLEGEHTPSAEWHQENEFNQFGAWNLSLPDYGLFTWAGRQ